MHRYRTPLAVVAGAAVIAAAVALRPVTRDAAAPRLATAQAATAPDPGALAPFLRFGGDGSVSVRPDRADISVGVDGTGASSRAALQVASTRIARVTARLRALGVAPDDLQTSDVSTYQDWDTKAWHAGVSLTVHVRDVKQAGRLLGAANAAGADNVSGPTFSVSNSRAAYAQALRTALADARAKADAAAAQMGVHVTGVVSVDEASDSTPYRAIAMDAAAAPQPQVPIETGTQDVTASVVVVFSYGR
jgi:uncharacterized protein YggE